MALLSVTGAVIIFGLAPRNIEAEIRGAVTHWGGWPIETTFAMLLLGAAVLTFRAFEALFRTHDAQALAALPVPGLARAIDRSVVICIEGAGLATLVALAVLPACFAANASQFALVALLYGLAGAFVCVGVTLGVVILAAVAGSVPDSWLAKSVDARSRSTAGGAAFQFAPGIAFAVCGAMLLLLKLGFEEPLRVFAADGHLEWTRAASFGVGIPLAVGVGLFVVGFRGLARNADVLSARFFESDMAVVDVGTDYFPDGAPPSSLAERRFGTRIGALYRKNRLQLARKHVLLRVGSWILGGILTLLALSGGDAVSWVPIALVSAAWIAMISPYLRLRALAGSIDALDRTVAADDERKIAGILAGTAELTQHGIAMLAVGIAATIATGHPAVLCVVLSALLATIASATRPTWSAIAIAITTAAIVAGGAGGSVGVFIGAACVAITTTIAIATTGRQLQPPRDP